MKPTNYHARELEGAGVAALWLDEERARNAYEFALSFSSRERYGLSEQTVSTVEFHRVRSVAAAAQWLRDRFPAHGTVQCVFGRTAVASHIAFYGHEDVFEVGRRVS